MSNQNDPRKTTLTSAQLKAARMGSWLERGMLSPNVPSPPPDAYSKMHKIDQDFLEAAIEDHKTAKD